MLTGLLDDLEQIFDEMIGDSNGWEIGAALVVLVATWPVAILTGWVVKKLLLLVPGVNFGIAMVGKRLVQLVVGLLGVAWSLTILDVGPGFILVIVIAVVATAVSLAQPLVRNIAAGAALPFYAGDQIETHQYAGTVADVNYRQTVIQTLDRRTVYVPNTDVLAGPIVVFTKPERRRSSLEVWVNYQTDIEDVSRLLVDTVSGIDGVHRDPAPYVIPSGFEDGRCQLILKWWHDPDLGTEEKLMGTVVTTVKATLDDAGVPIPPPVGVFLSEVPQTEPTP